METTLVLRAMETELCVRLCYLPDDLLVRILHFVPTKDAVATSILSKRWRPVWTMLPGLVFKDEGSESLGRFMEKSLQLHKAPKLLRLIAELGPSCSGDVDVGKLVENAVNRGVRVLDFNLLWNADPTSFPKSLYTCNTLVDLTLSNKILVDVSSWARLPSLLYLELNDVVYKEEDSLVQLLSSSPVLKGLSVERSEDDNLKNFAVKVPSLERLRYLRTSEVKDDEVEDDDDLNGSLVIDSPALTELCLLDYWGGYFLIENMPCLEVADITLVDNPSCDKFLTSLSSVIHLCLSLTQSMVPCCNIVKFSRLIEFYFCPETSVDWLEPLMFLLQSSPKLKSLTIDTNTRVFPSSWNQPSSIPGCLSSQLEIFGWRGYGGREDEKQLVTYILANSKCLKTVEISFIKA
ncbi:putative F-box/FBD/LRR-repeat protein At1g22000 [Eutrema salsugineum]|uniref:putative F-box/FBD/LRR-repeat protein At1g22000 n=1 Tax=Eutrema salsugineum TaxID=72664 RepID=UPI000CED2A8C|nr:putative F-box/FBD/LRR-repeat protein At1g22000 [Eutrema salsugineum]